MAHHALHLLGRNGEPLPWVLMRGQARWEGIPPARLTANSPELLVRLARSGVGIAAVADHCAGPYLADQQLAPVLPEWNLPDAQAWAVFPGRRLMPARTRAFIDALEAEFSETACRHAEAQIREAKRVAAG